MENTKGEKEVEVSILEGKLAEKDKQLSIQNNPNILDNLHNSQRSSSNKSGLNFYETVKGESSSKYCARKRILVKNQNVNKSINQEKEIFKENRLLLTIEI